MRKLACSTRGNLCIGAGFGTVERTAFRGIPNTAHGPQERSPSEIRSARGPTGRPGVRSRRSLTEQIVLSTPECSYATLDEP